MAGALEGISYELGGTLGVAVMGSIIASIYTQSFAPPPEAGLAPSAWDRLDQTLTAAAKLGGNFSNQIIEAGKAAFMHGVSTVMIGSSVLVIALFVMMALYARKNVA